MKDASAEVALVLERAYSGAPIALRQIFGRLAGLVAFTPAAVEAHTSSRTSRPIEVWLVGQVRRTTSIATFEVARTEARDLLVRALWAYRRARRKG